MPEGSATTSFRSGVLSFITFFRTCACRKSALTDHSDACCWLEARKMCIIMVRPVSFATPVICGSQKTGSLLFVTKSFKTRRTESDKKVGVGDNHRTGISSGPVRPSQDSIHLGVGKICICHLWLESIGPN